MASLFLLASLSLAFSWYCCQANLIADVCSKSINPSLCTQVLTSDPRSGGADLRGLGQIIIKKAKVATKDTISVAKSVSGGNNKEIVDTCVETCNDAIYSLNECSELLKAFDRKSIGDLQAKGSGALTDVGTCDDEFGESEPPKVKEASKKAQDLIDVLLVIANSL